MGSIGIIWNVQAAICPLLRTSVSANCMTDSPPCVHNESYNVYLFYVSHVWHWCVEIFLPSHVDYVWNLCVWWRKEVKRLLAIALYFIFLHWFGAIWKSGVQRLSQHSVRVGCSGFRSHLTQAISFLHVAHVCRAVCCAQKSASIMCMRHLNIIEWAFFISADVGWKGI